MFTRIRTTLIALAVALAVVALPATSSAVPIEVEPAKKDCVTPEGKTIKHGETGTSGGITYKCNDGVGCQVENGQTTGKCSHMARFQVAGQYDLGTVGTYTADPVPPKPKPWAVRGRYAGAVLAAPVR